MVFTGLRSRFSEWGIYHFSIWNSMGGLERCGLSAETLCNEVTDAQRLVKRIEIVMRSPCLKTSNSNRNFV